MTKSQWRQHRAIAYHLALVVDTGRNRVIKGRGSQGTEIGDTISRGQPEGRYDSAEGWPLKSVAKESHFCDLEKVNLSGWDRSDSGRFQSTAKKAGTDGTS